MPDHGLRITDVIDSVRKHRTVIGFITFAAAVAGAIFYLAGPKKYEGKTEFFLRNPTYGDRNFIYNMDNRFIDYFGNEDDIDRLMLMSESNIVQAKVIKNMNLAEAYKIDVSSRKGEQTLERRFSKNYNINRTEFKSLVLSYVDEDPERAAAVANECVKVLEHSFGEFYKDMRKEMYESISEKMHEEDSVINMLTDSLTILRNQYKIYDIVSPARFNLMLGTMKDNGTKEFARGVEIIQNVESLKDELVSDRAKHMSIVNQYKTGLRGDQLPLLKVVTVAKNPVSPKGIGGMYTVLACAFLGFFFSTLMMVFADSLKEERKNKIA